VWRWVQRYAPMLNQRLGRKLQHPNRSWRVDETYIRVAGRWTYLYRAVDSEGNTIDFMLSPHHDLIAAKHFLQLTLCRTTQIRPRVINVDGHPAYARAITELKRSGQLSRRCRCRPSPYLNNILERGHRFAKKRIVASLWFRSIDGALNTIEGYEAMHTKRSGAVARQRRRYRPGRIHQSAVRRDVADTSRFHFSRTCYLQHIRRSGYPLVGSREEPPNPPSLSTRRRIFGI
jgi:IS6 family transposase